MENELSEKELENVSGGVSSIDLPATYKVLAGDTLAKIANKYKVSWKKLYQLNKDVIDRDAKAHGVKSNFENHIYPGQVLKLR